jgi:hypothetical protein
MADTETIAPYDIRNQKRDLTAFMLQTARFERSCSSVFEVTDEGTDDFDRLMRAVAFGLVGRELEKSYTVINQALQDVNGLEYHTVDPATRRPVTHQLIGWLGYNASDHQNQVWHIDGQMMPTFLPSSVLDEIHASLSLPDLRLPE